MKKTKPTIIGVICLLLVCSCCYWIKSSFREGYFTPYTNERLKTLNNVDQIQIFIFFPPDYEPVYTKTITNQEEINIIVEKARTYADNWIQPTFGYFSLPQQPISVAISHNSETKSLKLFSIGNRFGFSFISSLPGGKYLSESEFKELMSVLGIDENCAYLSPANPTCDTDGFVEEEPFPAMP